MMKRIPVILWVGIIAIQVSNAQISVKSHEYISTAQAALRWYEKKDFQRALGKYEEAWFYFENKNGKYGFISSSGEIKFENEFDEPPAFLHPKIKVVLVYKNKLNGVIDLSTMTWMIKPMNEQIKKIDFTHTGNCNMAISHERLQILDLYFLILDSNNEEYYLDKNKVKYQPE